MKLLRVGAKGAERPALLDAGGVLRDLSGVIGDITGASLTDESLAGLAAIDAATLPAIAGSPRIGAPVMPGKVVGVGVNYHDHVERLGKPVPQEPVLFIKPTDTVIGPNDTVQKPKTSRKLDWECEFAIVIGREGANIAEADAMAHVAGWMLANDYTERWYQADRGAANKGKYGKDFLPLGPWLVTRDEIPHMDNRKMWSEVNGTRYQDGSSSTMIFKPAILVSHVSEFMVLYPGDIILTGTPAGVGMLQKPPLFLDQGDIVALGIEGLGEQRQRIV